MAYSSRFGRPRQRVHIHAGFAQQTGDAHIAVQDVDAGIALVSQHQVPVEGVVRLRTLFQVCVFECGDGQPARDLIQFASVEVRVAFQGEPLTATAAFRQQLAELHRAAAAGSEPDLAGLAVLRNFLQDHAVAKMS